MMGVSSSNDKKEGFWIVGKGGRGPFLVAPAGCHLAGLLSLRPPGVWHRLPNLSKVDVLQATESSYRHSAMHGAWCVSVCVCVCSFALVNNIKDDLPSYFCKFLWHKIINRPIAFNIFAR